MIRLLSLRFILVTLVTISVSLKSCPDDRQTLKPIKINLKQVQLLKNAADALAQRVSVVKTELFKLEAKGPFEEARKFLKFNVHETKKSVSRTSSTFEMYSGSTRQREASRIFFGEILRQYSGVDEALISVEMQDYPEVRAEAFQLLDYTVRAYATVAGRKLLTFDLVVTSVPPDATIYYFKRADYSRQHGDNTNTTLKNLTYAVWYVRVELDGFQSAEKSHDPFNEPNHILHFTLKPK